MNDAILHRAIREISHCLKILHTQLYMILHEKLLKKYLNLNNSWANVRSNDCCTDNIPIKH